MQSHTDDERGCMICHPVYDVYNDCCFCIAIMCQNPEIIHNTFLIHRLILYYSLKPKLRGECDDYYKTKVRGQCDDYHKTKLRGECDDHKTKLRGECDDYHKTKLRGQCDDQHKSKLRGGCDDYHTELLYSYFLRSLTSTTMAGRGLHSVSASSYTQADHHAGRWTHYQQNTDFHSKQINH